MRSPEHQQRDRKRSEVLPARLILARWQGGEGCLLEPRTPATNTMRFEERKKQPLKMAFGAHGQAPHAIDH